MNNHNSVFDFEGEPSTILWLHTPLDEFFVGPIIRGKFANNCLTVTLSKVARVKPMDPEHKRWVPVETNPYEYTFNFLICTTSKQSEEQQTDLEKVHLVSDIGDKITLSRRESDRKEVNDLLT